LLRFPQAKTPSGSYGSAIHKTLERLSTKIKSDGKKPSREECVIWFKEYMLLERLPTQEQVLFTERGVDSLSVFYDEKIDEFEVTDMVEVNFKNQGVLVEGAHLTGKIDRIIQMGGGKVVVCDFKTGKPKKEWNPKNEYEKIKLYEYERQLLFYKLLIDNSKDYKDKYSVSSGKLVFVEPLQNGRIAELHVEYDEDKLERLRRLVGIVYKNIMNLEFPDTSLYEETLEGIIKFEEELLSTQYKD
jgi:hypothetical protein